MSNLFTFKGTFLKFIVKNIKKIIYERMDTETRKAISRVKAAVLTKERREGDRG